MSITLTFDSILKNLTKDQLDFFIQNAISLKNTKFPEEKPIDIKEQYYIEFYTSDIYCKFDTRSNINSIDVLKHVISTELSIHINNFHIVDSNGFVKKGSISDIDECFIFTELYLIEHVVKSNSNKIGIKRLKRFKLDYD